ncbi:flagellar assembly protein T N-terminal domain-containing protein [Candidatus Puniceispirillum sp.]|nr:flagellar assembly protein T N-terminal domain-containing protein [Alphaproteobacteria bacterium]MDC1293741.1 flagellar assembly protein T N-terminal domain-containing protein [Candidatus Puniceispirillum sp.]
MVKGSPFLLILSLFFFCLPIANAKEEKLQIVMSTGRAAIISNEHIDETRARALEDALYSAALLGGAEIDGFSSVQAGSQLDDHFVVRPSSKIIDYDIVDEQFDDLHYTVEIEAAVGELKKIDCQNRLFNTVTIFKPVFRVDEKIPAWLSHQPAALIKSLQEQLARKSNFKLIDMVNSPLDPKELTRDKTYSYKALTSGNTKVLNGDFALSTTITLKRSIKKTNFQQNHFVDVMIESAIFVDGDYRPTEKVTHQAEFSIRNFLPTQFMSVLASPNPTKIRGNLSKLISQHAAELATVMRCTPLSATMIAKEDGLHIPIGSRQGLQGNRLAVVSNEGMPWTVLRVIKVNANGAVLMPLNRKRSSAQLNGQRVSFLEFK